VPSRAAPRQGLRIVAGDLKGRRLASPTWAGLRPTSDRLRETLFNILGQTCDGASVLDAFAGTGAVGIEALSRGAAHVMFVDHDPRALALIRQNLDRCGVTDRYTIQRMDLARSGLPVFPAAFDLIFLDPPYERNPTDACGALALSLATDGLLVAEHARRMQVPDTIGELRRTRLVTAGDSALSLFRRTLREPDMNEAA
jgi:16S rRNA (guanine(966)-N(2))-methyltransferase RsmD